VLALEPASIGSLYERAILDTGRQPAFLFLVSFLASWGFIRTSAHMIHAQVSWWPGNVQLGSTHVHHLVWGILILLAAGYVGVVIQPPSPWHEVLAVLFGIGTGLTLDEFALWLELKDVYWEEDGRRSIDAVIVAAGLSGMAVIGYTAWIELATDIEHLVLAAVGVTGAVLIAIAVVNAAKEKFATAAVGLLVPPVGLVGAVRLAKPNSLWARAFYRREHKRERARARFGSSADGPGALQSGGE
jgi:lysyl-tRNA synthetase, class II